MRRWRYFALALAGLTGATLVYADRDDDRGRGRRANRGYDYGYGDQTAANRAYQDGYARGQQDRARNRNYNPNRGAGRARSYRDAYRSGYDQGYNQGGYAGRNYPYSRSDPYGNNYPYGSNDPYRNNYPYAGNYSNQAYSVGVQDGRYDGEKDRRTGHSFRPTEGDRYKDGDRGRRVFPAAVEIPVRRGYDKVFAGAIECCACAGRWLCCCWSWG